MNGEDLTCFEVSAAVGKTRMMMENSGQGLCPKHHPSIILMGLGETVYGWRKRLKSALPIQLLFEVSDRKY